MGETMHAALPPGLAERLARKGADGAIERPIRIGTRQSPLAMAQAHMVAAALRAHYGLAADAIALAPVVASGDKVQDRALREVGGKALWTRELDRALAGGEIDCAVHSMKDVETERDAGFALAAVLPRADVRDVLLGAASIDAIPHGARLGTSSPRRAAQMRRLRPDIVPVLFRGNVATRIGKLAAGEADVTLLAAAGLDRLDERLHGIVHSRLATEDWLPAPSQGAIGIETRADDAPIRALAGAIGDTPTMQALTAERALLLALGGDCHSPIAALATLAGGMMTLRAALYAGDGSSAVEGRIDCAPDDGEAPARLAADLIGRAGPDIRALFRAGA